MDIISEIVKMGFPAMMRSGLTAVSSIVLNNMAGVYSASALAGMTVVNRVIMFLTAAILGFSQGFQPVVGFNWGAKRFDRVHKAFWFASISGVAVITVCSGVMAIFARQLMNLFSTTDSEMIAIGILSIQLQCLVMPIHAWVIVVNMLFAGLGKAKGAAILSISRQGICFIPMILLLPLAFGVNGLAAAQAASDVLSMFIAVPLCVSVLRELKQRMKENPNPLPAIEKMPEREVIVL
jgi:Na+-driven multidrug efflux pump